MRGGPASRCRRTPQWRTQSFLNHFPHIRNLLDRAEIRKDLLRARAKHARGDGGELLAQLIVVQRLLRHAREVHQLLRKLAAVLQLYGDAAGERIVLDRVLAHYDFYVATERAD